MSQGIARASAGMAAGTTVSRILGFVKAILLVSAIGQVGSLSGDAFANGNFLPNSIYILLLGGMLNAVLVPQIIKAAQAPDAGAAYINKVLTLVLVLLVVITAVALAVAPWIVNLFALSWGESQLALATAFAYWSLPQIIFYGLFTVLSEVLNSRQVFGPPAWAPVLNNVVGIAGIIVFMLMFGADPDGIRTPADWNPFAIALLAGSATIAVAAQAIVLFLAWRRAGIRYAPDFQWRGMGLRHTGKIASWSLATIVVMQLGGVVTTNVANSASGLGPSSLALQNAWLIFMLPHSILAVSLGTAYFTRFAHAAKSHDVDSLRSNFSESARTIMVVMVFASGAIFAAAPYVSRVMQPGANALVIDEFALVLRAYVLGLALYSLLFIVQRAFYALSDTKTPFWFTTVQIVLFAGGSVACLALAPSIRGAGIALVFGLATLIQVLIALWFLKRRIISIDGRRLGRSFAKTALSGVVATLVATIVVNQVNLRLVDTGFVLAILLSAGVALALGILYVVLLRLLRSEELEVTLNWVREKVRRR